MRSFLRGRPGPLVILGVAMMFYGVAAAYFLAAIAWGGFFYEPILVQVVGFGVPAAIFLAGVALVVLAGYRRCRSLISN